MTGIEMDAILIIRLSVIKLSIIGRDVMAKPDTSIDPRIMDSAKEEFRTLGFEKASLKSICQRAGVTTGALYKRYEIGRASCRERV